MSVSMLLNSSTMSAASGLKPTLKTGYKDVKNFLSVKTTASQPERRLSPLSRRGSSGIPLSGGALPPIGGTPSVPASTNGALPPIGGAPSVPASTNGALPPIGGTPSVSASTNGAEPHIPPDSSSTVDSTLASGTLKNENLPPYHSLTGHETTPGEQLHTSSANTERATPSADVNGNIATISRDNPFITSQLRAQPRPPPSTTTTVQNGTNQPEVR